MDQSMTLTNSPAVSCRQQQSCTLGLTKAAVWYSQDSVHQVPLFGVCLVFCSWRMGRSPLGATCLPCASRPSPSALCSARWSSAFSFPTVRPVCVYFHTRVPCWLWVSEVCVFLSVGRGAGKLYDVLECDFTSQWLSQSNTLPKSEP